MSDTVFVGKMMRTKSILILLATGAGILGLIAAQDALAKYEEPNYEVLQKQDDIEIRHYPSVVAAEVEVEGTGAEAANEAFRILAAYIFGKNVSSKKLQMTTPVTETKSSEKIAMTVPVTAIRSAGRLTMRFFMPAKYKIDLLPESIDKRIKFSTLPEARYVVIKFSGLAKEDNISAHETKLRKYLEEKKMVPSGQTIRAFYNPPWTLPFLRRNEVWIPIENSN